MDHTGLVILLENNIKKKYKYLMNYNKSNNPKYINIILEYNKQKYKFNIIENSDWWNKNNHKFYNKFDKCYEIFDEILIKENTQFIKKIEIINHNSIILTINYNNKLFPFKISIIFNKTMNKINNNNNMFCCTSPKRNISFYGNGNYKSKDNIEYYLNNKVKYRGSIVNNKYNGKGEFYYNNKLNTIKYNGLWINGDMNGYGLYYTNENKLLYRGKFKNNVFNGEGIIYFNNGIIEYEGCFLNNKYNNFGELYDRNGNIIYEGNFKNNLYEDRGIIYHKNNKIHYEGTFKNDLYNGYGILYDLNKNIIYEGEFNNGVYNGNGVLYKENTNNKNYEGEFINGFYNGEGSLFNNNNIIYKGKFKDGLRDGKGLQLQNNSTYYVLYEKDDFIKIIEDNEVCSICLDNPREIAFIPCGHKCICEECYKKYNNDMCIICRKEFSIGYKIYE